MQTARISSASAPLLTALLLATLLLAPRPLAAQGRRPTRPQVARPDGEVWDVIRHNCTRCHGIDDYAFHALDSAGWQSLLETKHKVSGGYSLNETARNLLVDWLVSKFGPEEESRSREPTHRPRSPRSSPIPRRTACSTVPAQNATDWTGSKTPGIPRNIGA